MVVSFPLNFFFGCYSLTTKQKCIFVAVIVGITVGLLVYFYSSGYFTQVTENELSPPDPTTPVQPSASKLRAFKKAAVCVDAAVCAEVGK